MLTLNDLIKRWPNFHLDFGPTEQRFEIDIWHNHWTDGYLLAHRTTYLGNRKIKANFETLDELIKYVFEVYGEPKEKEVTSMKIFLDTEELERAVANYVSGKIKFPVKAVKIVWTEGENGRPAVSVELMEDKEG